MAQNFNTKLCLQKKVDTMDLDDSINCKWISIFPFPRFIYEEKMVNFEDLLERCEDFLKEVANANNRPSCDVCQSEILDDDINDDSGDKINHILCRGRINNKACSRVVCTKCIDDRANTCDWLIDDTDDIYYCSSCKTTQNNDFLQFNVAALIENNIEANHDYNMDITEDNENNT